VVRLRGIEGLRFVKVVVVDVEIAFTGVPLSALAAGRDF
jgi:hypothetical protein